MGNLAPNQLRHDNPNGNDKDVLDFEYDLNNLQLDQWHSLGFVWYIYKQDKIEKEPMKLLIKLIILGIISAFCSMIPEEIMDNVLSITVGEFLGKGVFAVFSAFIGVAVIEEGFKFIFLRIGSWKNPAFNYKFDAVVYAVL